MNSEPPDFSDSRETEQVDSFVRNIEQLEEATSQLKKGTITSTRIAFLRIHNILDLLTYDFAKYSFWRWEKKRLSAREMFEYLSDFNNRINYLGKKNILNEEDRDILKVFHYLRNESYHTGTIKSRVLPSVTMLSHNKVCELLKLLSPHLSHHKYNNKYIQNSVEKYSKEFKIEIKYLAKQLSQDLLSRIKFVLDSLSTVCLENIELEDENQVNNMLIWVQSTYWDQTILGLNQVKNFKQAIKVIEAAPKENIDEFYSKHYTYQKIKTWKTKALNLQKSDKFNKILMVWKEIDEHLAHIELMLETASIDIDDWIDWEAEVFRGR